MQNGNLLIIAMEFYLKMTSPIILFVKLEIKMSSNLGNTMVFKKVTLLAREIDTRRCCIMF